MPGLHDDDLAEQLDGMRMRFAAIDRQLVRALQDDIGRYRPARGRPAPVPPPAATPVAAPVIRAATAPPPPPPPRPAPEPDWIERQTAAAKAALRRSRGELGLSDFVGLRALAWAGGVITLLGIAFFYVLANQNGWVGPGSRVLLGTAISSGLIGLAWWLRSLKGQPEAALAAAGTGIAGLYVTLFAATKLYEYIPTIGGMPLALAIAALAVVIALAWSAEALALLGLVGAALAPPLVAGGVSPAAVAFAGIVAAAAMVLWVLRDWRFTAAAVSAAALPQLAWLVVDQRGAAPAPGWNEHWQTVALAGCLWAVYLATGLVRYLRSGRLDRTTLAVLASTSSSAIAAAALLFDGRQRGWAMLAVALAYAGLAATPRLIGRPSRDLSSVFAATALTAALVATGELLGGGSRAVAVSAEGALMVWLAARFREQRLQLASIAYLTVAALLTLVQAPLANLVDFPPVSLTGPGGQLDGALVAAEHRQRDRAGGGSGRVRGVQPADGRRPPRLAPDHCGRRHHGVAVRGRRDDPGRLHLAALHAAQLRERPHRGQPGGGAGGSGAAGGGPPPPLHRRPHGRHGAARPGRGQAVPVRPGRAEPDGPRGRLHRGRPAAAGRRHRLPAAVG